MRYDVVDVFTDRAYAGNPLAVVHGGDRLSTAQMQAIAAEFGLSETAFPLPPTTTDADYRLRIFTPARRAAVRRPPERRVGVGAGRRRA